MSIAIKCSACGHEMQAEPDGGAGLPPCPACGAALAPGESKPGVLRVSAADVVKPAPIRVSAADVVAPAGPKPPPLQTFEELGIPDKVRRAVEEQLSKDEKLLWLGKASKNPEVFPPQKMHLTVVGVIVLLFAIALPFIFKGMPFFFPVAFGLFGILFLVAGRLMNPSSAYQACCYVVTNRRAILVEWGMSGIDIKSSGNLVGVRHKSYLPHQLLGMERRKNPRVPGAGDLVFEYIMTVGKGSLGFAGAEGPRRTDTPQRTPRGFFYLDNVAEVEQLIRTTLLANLEKAMDQ